MLKVKLNKMLRCKLVKMWISKVRNTTDFQEEKHYPQNRVSPKGHRVRKHDGTVNIRYYSGGKATSDSIILY